MAKDTTASGRWSELDGLRQGFIARCEKYARLTIPSVCVQSGYDQNNSEMMHDYSSVGAQAVNHLANKLLLTLFAPSRPFFRLDPSDSALTQASSINLSEIELKEILATIERKAVKEMDKKAMRPKLLQAIINLVVTGNVLLILDKKRIRVIGIRNYVVVRNIYGDVIEIILRDVVRFGQLDEKVRDLAVFKGKKDEEEVEHYQWICRDEKGEYKMTQWVDSEKLSDEFDGKWPEHKLPYRALTWIRNDGDNYGTGHVEPYAGSLEAMSILSEAELKAAVLASEFRWLVNPMGITDAEEFARSENGAAIPGNQGDITPLNSGTGLVLQYTRPIIDDHKATIGRGFLLNSNITRDAERVTAHEIQLQAQELETSLGGAYSRIAVDLQAPLAVFLLDLVDFKYKGKDFEPIVITGVEALSRAGDVDKLLSFLSTLGNVQQLNPNANLLGLIDLGAVATELAAGFGIDSTKYLSAPEQIQQVQQAASQAPMPGAPPQDPTQTGEPEQ